VYKLLSSKITNDDFTKFEEEHKLNKEGRPIEQESSGLDISYNTSL
jgi:hypothetical protein